MESWIGTVDQSKNVLSWSDIMKEVKRRVKVAFAVMDGDG